MKPVPSHSFGSESAPNAFGSKTCFGQTLLTYMRVSSASLAERMFEMNLESP